MKRTLIVAGIVGCITVMGCESRFTSTSDSSGPRKHDYADPSFEYSGNTGKNAMMPIETIDSGRGNQMNTRTDSIKPANGAQDTTHAAGH